MVTSRPTKQLIPHSSEWLGGDPPSATDPGMRPPSVTPCGLAHRDRPDGLRHGLVLRHKNLNLPRLGEDLFRRAHSPPAHGPLPPSAAALITASRLLPGQTICNSGSPD